MKCVGGRVDPKDGKKRILKRNIQKAEKWKVWINIKNEFKHIIYFNQCG